MTKTRKLLLGALFFLFSLLIGGTTIQAASMKTICTNCEKNITFSADMTNDGKKDKIEIKVTKNNYGELNHIRVYINGKGVLSAPTDHFYDYDVEYLYLSKSRQFVHILALSDSGGRALNSIYRYDAKKGKLVEVLDLNSSGVGAGGNVVSVTPSSITVRNTCQPSLTGRVYWNYTYTYTNNKFKLKSSIASTKTLLGKMPIHDGYEKYFQKQQYKARKTLTFYTDTNLTKTAFTAKSGSVVTLKKVRCIGKDMYFQFQKGTKTGWIKNSNSSYDAFYGVSSRMAGGFYG